ncbi:MAG: hypothetical protein HZA78_01515 [Candidatus Schekmanbacteria bacterium]|nr:hypothetical protein [Candidatus Schekmanbacteria bacterium]
MNDDSFSRRYGYVGKKEITKREDAPRKFRMKLLSAARKFNLPSKTMRYVICEILGEPEDDGHNWGEPNVSHQIEGLILKCDWFYVYEICEGFYKEISNPVVYNEDFIGTLVDNKALYSRDINTLFEELEIGWKMEAGKIVAREDEQLEGQVKKARNDLKSNNLPTSLNEMKQARACLSRRPEPDITGAIDHCIAALECTVKEISGSSGSKTTFGRLIQKHAEKLGIPKPLDTALEKLWGYASDNARHVKEGKKPPSRHEAELILGISSVMISYILGKASEKEPVPF